MAFNIMVGDICKIPCDAIVNSIGTDNTIFGRLCENIVKESHSKELESYLKSLTDNKINQLYVTDGYDIPCKKILHITTPYRKLDEGNRYLKEAYKTVLEYAYANNLKNICIPYIGTGANGYSDTEAYDAATDTCAFFADKYDDFEITLVLYSGKKKLRKVRKEHYDEIDRRLTVLSGSCEAPVRITDTAEELLEFNETMILRPFDEYYSPKCGCYDNPAEFIDEYIDSNDKSLRKEINNVLGRKRMSDYRNNVRKMKKDVFLAAALLCNFSFGTFKLYLTMFGYSLTPYSDLDHFYFDYYTGKVPKGKTWTFYTQYYYENYSNVCLITKDDKYA